MMNILSVTNMLNATLGTDVFSMKEQQNSDVLEVLLVGHQSVRRASKTILRANRLNLAGMVAK
jgi:hypothetical protein